MLKNMNQGACAKVAAASAGVLAGALCAYHVYNEIQKSKLPTEWKEVGSLKDIFFYPIKSCGSTHRNRAECTFLGLKDGWLRDRIMMVVDEKNHFVTARVHPKLLLIQPTLVNSILTLRCKDMEPIEMNLEEIIALHKPTQATTWIAKYPVYDLGWEVSEWLSRFLVGSTSTFKLMLYAARDSRRDFYNKIQLFSKKDNGAFADEVPFNLINQASIDDLNTRLNGIEVSHKNFRANFILSGAKAYDEDNWKFVKIGENIFEIIKPCTSFYLLPDETVQNQIITSNYKFLLLTVEEFSLLEPILTTASGHAYDKHALSTRQNQYVKFQLNRTPESGSDLTRFHCDKDTRCVMTTNNPETGTRNPSMEPLTTLRSYRQHTDPELRRFAGSTPRMGVQMVLRSNNGGIVSINDAIYVA